MRSQTPCSALVLVDAHVHLHPGFPRDVFLDAALRNVRREAAALDPAAPRLGCLLLAEMGGTRWFHRARGGREDRGSWRFEQTGEAESLVARHAGGESLLLLAGRQIATREGLEILALAADLEIPDGLPFSEALVRVRAGGALAVIPWGFGKWWGRRGEIVAGALARRSPGSLFLGDNGGRPAAGHEPRLFATARARGIAVLPGSDPLPLPAHAGRAGSYGFVLAGALDAESPAAHLRRRVRQLREQPPVFGRRVPLPRFVRDQLALRWRGRPGASSRARRTPEAVP